MWFYYMFKWSELKKVVHSCWKHFWFVITWCWYFILWFHMYPYVLCFSALCYSMGSSPFRLFSFDIEFVKCLDIIPWISWKLFLKIFSFIHLHNDCKKQTIIIKTFGSKTLNIMWCNLKALQMMCHLKDFQWEMPLWSFLLFVWLE